MDKQAVESVVAKFLDSEQGEALVAECLVVTIDRNPEILSRTERRPDESDPEVFLTREEIFNQAVDLSAQHNEGIDFWVDSIQSAIKKVNKAQPEPGP